MRSRDQKKKKTSPLILNPELSPSESLSDSKRSLNSFLSSSFLSWIFLRFISGRSRSSIYNTHRQCQDKDSLKSRLNKSNPIIINTQYLPFLCRRSPAGSLSLSVSSTGCNTCWGGCLLLEPASPIQPDTENTNLKIRVPHKHCADSFVEVYIIQYFIV